VPETYLIVRNNDLIVNKRLLIFADGKGKAGRNNTKR